jgi:hypothetical protein
VGDWTGHVGVPLLPTLGWVRYHLSGGSKKSRGQWAQVTMDQDRGRACQDLDRDLMLVSGDGPVTFLRRPSDVLTRDREACRSFASGWEANLGAG